jgi:hypothetical protein
VTVIAAPETATLKSFHRPEAAGSVAGALHSSLTVPASELLKYELTMRSRETEGGGTAYYGRFDVTFALKDLAVSAGKEEEGGAAATAEAAVPCSSSRVEGHRRVRCLPRRSLPCPALPSPLCAGPPRLR